MNVIYQRLKTGFTLIELLVVVCIIVLITSMTVLTLRTMLGDEGLKQSALIVKNAFEQTRQLAASERMMYFLAFIPDKKGTGQMQVYKDSDEDNMFSQDSDKDEPVGIPIELSQGIIFVSGSNGPALFQSDKPYVGFYANGSVMLPSGVPDLAMPNDPRSLTDANADIVLAHKKDRPARVYLDIDVVGTIRKTYYKQE